MKIPETGLSLDRVDTTSSSLQRRDGDRVAGQSPRVTGVSSQSQGRTNRDNGVTASLSRDLKQVKKWPIRSTARVANRKDPSDSLQSMASTASASPNEGDDREDQSNAIATQFLNVAPPWMISFIFHLAAFIILGLILIPIPVRDQISIEAIFSEDLGDQLEEEPLRLTDNPLQDLEEQILTPENLPPVMDPFAAPPEIESEFKATSSTSRIDAPTIGVALTGREKGMKQALLAAYGGTATTEEAVLLGLQWLKRNQSKDGSWSLTGPYSNGASAENRVAATAMALLAFQGAGHTHKSGQFKTEVQRGWAWLREQQGELGEWSDGLYNHKLYTHAQATIAICELYGMSRDPSLRDIAQKAVDYAVSAQGRRGGWKYNPGERSDTSVTGWFVMALQSAMMAGLEVPSPVLEKVSRFLDQVSSHGGTRYAYEPGRGATEAMTAEALLCRQYLGWSRDDPRLIQGMEYVQSHPIDWHKMNVYYWYYATQIMHHMEGEFWESWNSVMRQTVPAKQQKSGKERGSWDRTGDRWGGYGGRLYTTCLCIYMLEVYYRHLPIYSNIYRGAHRTVSPSY